jgi:HAD superfamily hydrolase (TIGR01490 family)
MTRLALFDLDDTLLSGDSDALWGEFLMNEGLLDRADFGPRNADMALRYREADVSAQEFCEFYVATLAGKSPGEWRPICEKFLREAIMPRIPMSARELVQSHRELGHRLVLTTATNRVLTELTAQYLRIDDLIATDVEVAEGICTGRTSGTLNMREGKVTRLCDWLLQQGLPRALMADAVFYSDSSNDIPLLMEVGEPIVVDPDAGLRARAIASKWEIMTLLR